MKLNNERIENEVASLSKIQTYNNYTFPYSTLDDRAFEVLVYLIFKKKIEVNDYDLDHRFDHVDLMEGVGEKGRDSVLLKEQKNTGVIQCKKVDSNITKTSFCKELIKFLLHYTQDKRLIDNLDNFTYYFVVSKGLAGKTKDLIRQFNTLILKETEIQNWTNEVIKSYKAFDNLQYTDVKNDLYLAFKKIQVERVLPEDLTHWLQNMPDIIQMFFDTKVVTETKYIKDLEDKYLKPILKSSHINKNILHIKDTNKILQEVDAFINNQLKFLKNHKFDKIKMLLQELALNAEERGDANNITVKKEKNTLIISDDGKKFNPLKELNKRNGGASRTLKYIKEYSSNINFQYKYENDTNYLIIIFEKDTIDQIEDCTLIINDLELMIENAVNDLLKKIKDLNMEHDCDELILDVLATNTPISVQKIFIDSILKNINCKLILKVRKNDDFLKSFLLDYIKEKDIDSELILQYI